MAAFSTGSDWSFPEDMPGAWSQNDVDAQLHSESDRPQPTSTSQPRTKSEDQPKPKKKHYPPRTCRICLDSVLPTFHSDENSALPASLQPDIHVTYESPKGEGGRMLRPCKCKGSQKYVHEECIQAWRMQDPLQKRNFWQCPTCRYKYKLQRLTIGGWLGSIHAQIALTAFIFIMGMFFLGFVADPIINLYLDPIDTISSAGGPTGSFIYEDEPATWTEHFIKGLASLGLLGFAKFFLTLSPWQWFNMRGLGGGYHHGGMRNTGRDRVQQLSWITLMIGIATVMYALWKGVRAFSRRMLENAADRVLDVPGDPNEDDEDD